MALGKLFHGVVSDCLQAFLQDQDLDFETWLQKVR